MNDRSTAITVLCSHLCAGEGVIPLEPKEYSSFAALLRSRKIDPEEILRFHKQDFIQSLDMAEDQADRFLRLLDRGASLSFEISKYESMGITVLTRADTAYPKKLKEKLSARGGGSAEMVQGNVKASREDILGALGIGS